MSTRRILFGAFVVTIEGSQLKATAWGEGMDREASSRKRPVPIRTSPPWSTLLTERDYREKWLGSSRSCA